MTATRIQSQAWERYLLALAQEARDSFTSPTPIADQVLRARAYGHCRELTRRHSRTFFAAASLLPPAQRAAVWALYAFCRTGDDLVDAPAPIPPPPPPGRIRCLCWCRRDTCTGTGRIWRR